MPKQTTPATNQVHSPNKLSPEQAASCASVPTAGMAAWTWAGPQESPRGPTVPHRGTRPCHLCSLAGRCRLGKGWTLGPAPTRHHGSWTLGKEEKEAQKLHGAFPRHGFPCRAQPSTQKTWGSLKGADETAISALSAPLTADGDRVGKNQLFLRTPILQIRLACQYRKNSLKHLEEKGKICNAKITAP